MSRPEPPGMDSRRSRKAPLHIRPRTVHDNYSVPGPFRLYMTNINSLSILKTTSRLQRPHARFASEDQHVRRTMRKQPDCYHAGDLIDGCFELHRVDDAQAMHVENEIAVVGHAVLPPHRLTAQL